MTMQRQVGVRSSLLSDGDCFDMWHDYMGLGRMLVRLCATGDLESSKREAATWRHIRTSLRQSSVGTQSVMEMETQSMMEMETQTVMETQSVMETSSASSLSGLSDSSCSGASSSYCRFCKQNGESARVYRSHKLKSDDGKVSCPILWRYTCPTCGATGDQAHTRRYCPVKDTEKMLRVSNGH